jgi:hypothetical protein
MLENFVMQVQGTAQQSARQILTLVNLASIGDIQFLRDDC